MRSTGRCTGLHRRTGLSGAALHRAALPSAGLQGRFSAQRRGGRDQQREDGKHTEAPRHRGCRKEWTLHIVGTDATAAVTLVDDPGPILAVVDPGAYEKQLTCLGGRADSGLATTPTQSC